MSRLLGYFARGCLAIVPVAATIYILYVVVTALDALLGVSIPGLGIVVAVALITGVGFLVSNVIGRQVYWLADRTFARLPLVKLLYTSIRDLVSAFVGKKKSFGQPVAVRLTPNARFRLLGFMTRPDLALPMGAGPATTAHEEVDGSTSAPTEPEYVAVYVPQAYNIGGQVLVVPADAVEPLETSSTELLTFMLSGGAAGFGVQERGEEFSGQAGSIL